MPRAPGWRSARPAATARARVCSYAVQTGGIKQALLRQPFAIEQPREVLRAGVAQHGDHGVARAQIARHLHGRRDINAAGAADKQPLLAQQPIDVAYRVEILDRSEEHTSELQS